MLEIRSLSKSFGGVKATDNVTLDFVDGSLTAVIGPNGAGKSTFFNLITGALKPDSGDAVAWRPEAARHRAGARARSQGAAARRAHRRHGHGRALADDRQGEG